MTDTYKPVLPPEFRSGNEITVERATITRERMTEILADAIEAYQRQNAWEDSHFDLWQDDMVVASTFGPRDRALAEIQHYANVYRQDGPVEIHEVTSRRIEV
jgi:hypothetical protein